MFFWKMTIDAKQSDVITDLFIPELFFDYFLVKTGGVQCVDEARGWKFTPFKQALKTIHARPLRLFFFTPLVLYGVRLSLSFAESFRDELNANSFLEQAWVRDDIEDLDSFKMEVEEHLHRRGRKKHPYPMFSSGLRESAWLVHFSPRHKRRLYRETFGLSRRELLNIQNVQSFLEQTCDFASENPRIIRHVDPEVFYDQPHLNRTFRKLIGISPLEYFETNSILQDNLMSASYNVNQGQ